MALGSVVAPLAASAAITAGSSLFSSLMGNKKNPTAPLQQFTPPGVDAGGLRATFGGNQFSVTASPEREALVSNISGTFTGLANEIAGLRSRIAPGVSDFRTARLGEIENARSAAVGNLRDNLARRRALGSSFGADALARTEAEFAQQKERVAAESYLQEIGLTLETAAQEFTARTASFQTFLDEMNFETSLATSLAGKATDVMAKNAQVEAELLAKQSAGAGQFFGQFIAPLFGKAFGASTGGTGTGASPGGFGTGSLNASGAI